MVVGVWGGVVGSGFLLASPGKAMPGAAVEREEPIQISNTPRLIFLSLSESLLLIIKTLSDYMKCFNLYKSLNSKL